MRILKKDDIQDTDVNMYFNFNDVLFEYSKDEYKTSFNTAFEAAYEILTHTLDSDNLLFYNTVHDAALAYITTDDAMNSPDAKKQAIGIANTALHQHITTTLLKNEILANFNKLCLADDISATLH